MLCLSLISGDFFTDSIRFDPMGNHQHEFHQEYVCDFCPTTEQANLGKWASPNWPPQLKTDGVVYRSGTSITVEI